MIDTKRFLAISRRLEQYHAVFYAMWELGAPVSDPLIPRACIRFDADGDAVQFAFNPDYFAACTDDDLAFAIAHECLHVLLRHGVRSTGMKDQRRVNASLDLVVNHMLVREFGVQRDRITNWQEFYWVDTAFKDEKVSDCLSYEEYHAIVPSTDDQKTVDEHSGWNDEDGSWMQKVVEKLSPEEAKSVSRAIRSHTQGDILSCFVDSCDVKPKKKWETIIKEWAMPYCGSASREAEHWIASNRRWSLLDSDLFLPTDLEMESDDKGRIQVWFFQDTSGSCAEHRERFFQAAASLPKRRFDVRLFCFDTQVYATTLESRKLFGFGGTSYEPLEHFIQITIQKEGSGYPRAVFVITDGYGTEVHPARPRNWHWFLTTTYTRYIPEGSKVYRLQDFE